MQLIICELSYLNKLITSCVNIITLSTGEQTGDIASIYNTISL